jgi:trans-aconitate methyltransferase
MKGFMYWHPKLYGFTMKLLYGKKEHYRRYDCMAKECKGMSVLDIGCADCHLAEYFPKDKYLGIDINKEFIKSAREKGINVKKIDAKKQKLPKAECIMISAILHQVYPHHEELIKKALNSATKRVVICEPITHLASSKNSFMAKIARMINNPGYGSPKKRLNKQELFAVYKKYNASKVYEIGRDSIAIFNIKKK